MNGGKPQGGGLFHCVFQPSGKLFLGDRAGISLGKQPHGVFPEDAVQPAVFIPANLPAHRVGRSPVQARQGNGGGIGGGDVLADPGEDQGIFRGHGVQLPEGGHLPVRETVLVPAPSQHQPPRRELSLPDKGPEDFAHLPRGGGGGQVSQLHPAAGFRQVQMAVPQPRQQGESLQVDGLGPLPRQLQQLLPAYSGDAGAVYSHGGGPRGSGTAGPNPAVVKDEVHR